MKDTRNFGRDDHLGGILPLENAYKRPQTRLKQFLKNGWNPGQTNGSERVNNQNIHQMSTFNESLNAACHSHPLPDK